MIPMDHGGRKQENLQDDRRSPGHERGPAALLEHRRRAALGRQPRLQGAAQPGKPRDAARSSAARRRRERARNRLRHRRGDAAARKSGRRAGPRRRGRHLRADARRRSATHRRERRCTMSHCCPATRRCWRSNQAAFDVATSRMGVMFFADPVAAFRNIGRRIETRRPPGLRLLGAARREPALADLLRHRAPPSRSAGSRRPIMRLARSRLATPITSIARLQRPVSPASRSSERIRRSSAATPRKRRGRR